MLGILNMKKIVLWLLIIMVSGFAIGGAILFSTGGIKFTNNGSVNFEGKYKTKIDDEKTIPLESIDKLNIESASTDINFLLSDNNEVRAHLYGGINSNREDYIPELKAQINGGEGRIKVQWPSDWIVGNFASNLKLDVYIPSSYTKSLQLACTSANVHINGLSLSSFEAGSVSGDFKVEDLQAKIFSIETTSGVVRINKVTCEDFNFKSVSGDLTGDTLSDKSGKFDTISGNIRVENYTGDTTLTTVSGDVNMTYSTFSNDISMSTTSGDVSISLPEASNFGLDFSTTSGSFRNELPMTFSKNSERNVKGNSGDTSNQIDIRTTSGDLETLKR